MKKLLLLLGIVLLSTPLIFSCNSDQDEEPLGPLIGEWESRAYVDSLGLWSVETLDFLTDSTYQLRQTFRESEFGSDLGYRFIYNFDYHLENEIIDYQFIDGFEVYMFPHPDIGPLYAPFEDLREFLIDFSFGDTYAEWSLSENQLELDLSFSCPSYDGNCPVLKKYERSN